MSNGHRGDSIAPGGIVTVRDRLFDQQAHGRRVYRLAFSCSTDQVVEAASLLTDIL